MRAVEELSRPAIKRVLRTEGIARVSQDVYEATRLLIFEYCQQTLEGCVALSRMTGKKTLSKKDILTTLKCHGIYYCIDDSRFEDSAKAKKRHDDYFFPQITFERFVKSILYEITQTEVLYMSHDFLDVLQYSCVSYLRTNILRKTKELMEHIGRSTLMLEDMEYVIKHQN